MIRLSILIGGIVFGALALSGAAFAQQVIVPSPGTIEDPSIPIKLVADGPPRALAARAAQVGAAQQGDKKIVIAAALTAHP